MMNGGRPNGSGKFAYGIVDINHWTPLLVAFPIASLTRMDAGTGGPQEDELRTLPSPMDH